MRSPQSVQSMSFQHLLAIRTRFLEFLDVIHWYNGIYRLHTNRTLFLFTLQKVSKWVPPISSPELLLTKFSVTIMNDLRNFIPPVNSQLHLYITITMTWTISCPPIDRSTCLDKEPWLWSDHDILPFGRSDCWRDRSSSDVSMTTSAEPSPSCPTAGCRWQRVVSALKDSPSRATMSGGCQTHSELTEYPDITHKSTLILCRKVLILRRKVGLLYYAEKYSDIMQKGTLILHRKVLGYYAEKYHEITQRSTPIWYRIEKYSEISRIVPWNYTEKYPEIMHVYVSGHLYTTYRLLKSAERFLIKQLCWSIDWSIDWPTEIALIDRGSNSNFSPGASFWFSMCSSSSPVRFCRPSTTAILFPPMYLHDTKHLYRLWSTQSKYSKCMFWLMD